MKKVKLEDVGKLDLTKESAAKVSQAKQTLAFQNILKNLGTIIQNNTDNTTEIKQLVGSETKAIKEVVAAMKGVKTLITEVKNKKPEVQKIEVINKPKLKEYVFAIKYNSKDKPIEITAKQKS